MPASDVGHRDAGPESGFDAIQRRKPCRHQIGVVAGAEEALGAAKQAGTMFVPAETLAGAEGFGDFRLILEHR
jgi:hypothetical protein